MSLAQFSIDDGPHNMDGLRLLAQDGAERVEAFVGRKVLQPTASLCRGIIFGHHAKRRESKSNRARR